MTPRSPPTDVYREDNPDGRPLHAGGQQRRRLRHRPRHRLRPPGAVQRRCAVRAGGLHLPGSSTPRSSSRLNEDIGGYDIDGNRIAERTTIADDVAALGYEVGAITGEGPLQDVPIILRSPYTDPFGDIHTRYHAFSIRERLRVDGMDDPNLALWTSAAGGGDLVGRADRRRRWRRPHRPARRVADDR